MAGDATPRDRADHAHESRAHAVDVGLPLDWQAAVADIKPPQILAVRRRVEARGAHETAYRLKQRIAQVYRYAIVNGVAESNPASEMRGEREVRVNRLKSLPHEANAPV